MQIKFIGKNDKFLMNGHTYEVSFEQNPKYGYYETKVTYDYTDNKVVEYFASYSSQVSIRQNFEIEGEVVYTLIENVRVRRRRKRKENSICQHQI